jgi:hypothetical protein
MGFFGSFFGNDQRKDIERANQQATASLEAGKQSALTSYGNAQGMYQPYAQQGGRANALYGDATGANGQDAYRAAMGNFAGSDPFRQQNEAYARQADQNRYSARGWSGNASLAAARASTERGATDWNNYLMRLQGQGQQGLQATGAMAGLEQGKGDIQSGFGQQMAGNAINYGNALAGSRNIGLQNILGVAGTAAKFFAPSPGGGSPGSPYGQPGGGGYSPGTMANGGWTTSVNKLWGGR